jgi:hypothetical protein
MRMGSSLTLFLEDFVYESEINNINPNDIEV